MAKLPIVRSNGKHTLEHRGTIRLVVAAFEICFYNASQLQPLGAFPMNLSVFS